MATQFVSLLLWLLLTVIADPSTPQPATAATSVTPSAPAAPEIAAPAVAVAAVAAPAPEPAAPVATEPAIPAAPSVPAPEAPRPTVVLPAPMAVAAAAPAYEAPVAADVVESVPPAPPLFTAEQLEELLGPIALYPDALVALILPSATQPTHVVLAARFLKAGRASGEIDYQPWDDSVRSLARYPVVVRWMDENLEWTEQLGQAFLDQPADVMNAIQRLRARARAAGTLTDTAEQQVVVVQDEIRIVPAQPTVIYVPTYDPAIVYVSRPRYRTTYISFNVCYPAGYWLAYDCDWRHRRVWVVPHDHRRDYWRDHRDDWVHHRYHWRHDDFGRPAHYVGRNDWMPWTPGPGRPPRPGRDRPDGRPDHPSTGNPGRPDHNPPGTIADNDSPSPIERRREAQRGSAPSINRRADMFGRRFSPAPEASQPAQVSPAQPAVSPSPAVTEPPTQVVTNPTPATEPSSRNRRAEIFGRNRVADAPAQPPSRATVNTSVTRAPTPPPARVSTPAPAPVRVTPPPVSEPPRSGVVATPAPSSSRNRRAEMFGGSRSEVPPSSARVTPPAATPAPARVSPPPASAPSPRPAASAPRSSAGSPPAAAPRAAASTPSRTESQPPRRIGRDRDKEDRR